MPVRFLNEPGAWWGYHGWHNRPRPMSVAELIDAGSLSSETAALLWMALDHGASIIVSSPPQRAGKTTTLTALLSFVPAQAWGYFSRGQSETFAELPVPEPGVPAYILMTELSNHLPIYTWGQAALRAFDLLGAGYSLASTMHAVDAFETLTVLERALGVAPERLAKLGIVVSIRARMVGRQAERKVSELALVRPDGDGYAIDTLGLIEPEGPGFVLRDDAAVAIAERFRLDASSAAEEQKRRTELLDQLVRDRVMDVASVDEAIRGYAMSGPRYA